MTDYLDNVSHLNDYCFFLKKQLAEIKNNFSEINMFYKYLTQKHKTLVNKGEILMKLQNLRNK